MWECRAGPGLGCERRPPRGRAAGTPHNSQFPWLFQGLCSALGPVLSLAESSTERWEQPPGGLPAKRGPLCLWAAARRPGQAPHVQQHKPTAPEGLGSVGLLQGQPSPACPHSEQLLWSQCSRARAVGSLWDGYRCQDDNRGHGLSVLQIPHEELTRVLGQCFSHVESKLALMFGFTFHTLATLR